MPAAALAALLALALLVVLAGPSPAATSDDPSSSGSSSGSGSDPSGTGPRTAAQAQADAAQQGEQVEAARSELAQAAAAATEALEAYSLARHAYLASHTAQAEAETALARADAELAVRRADLGRWAREAYQSGSEIADNPTLVAILGGNSNDVTHTRHIMIAVGSQRERAVEDMERALTLRTEVAATTARRAQESKDLLAASERARTLRDQAVSAQRATVDRLETRLENTLDEAARLAQEEQQAAEARALVMARSGGSIIGPGGNVVTGEIGSCQGGQTELYGNGQIPLAALCPLWGAPGEHLRADAAYAFNQLSAAYARQFGRPICVTDSYRSYPEQVAVKAAKPRLAATPGTSNHGWGTALDLCGGVQSFSSVPHQWLKLNAPAFGWFHPSWAEPSGRLPEPWHWEFAG